MGVMEVCDTAVSVLTSQTVAVQDPPPGHCTASLPESDGSLNGQVQILL